MKRSRSITPACWYLAHRRHLLQGEPPGVGKKNGHLIVPYQSEKGVLPRSRKGNASCGHLLNDINHLHYMVKMALVIIIYGIVDASGS
ncbi:hypothetical protein EHI95_03370 [Cronobacter dublinensis]|nr:hypothetical protein [Cronobacter dublinensis]